MQCKRECLFHFTLAGILSILRLSIKNKGVRGGLRGYLLNGQNLLSVSKVICRHTVPNKLPDPTTGKFGIPSVVHQYYKEIIFHEKNLNLEKLVQCKF